jgi:hypothetical protein
MDFSDFGFGESNNNQFTNYNHNNDEIQVENMGFNNVGNNNLNNFSAGNYFQMQQIQPADFGGWGQNIQLNDEFSPVSL